MNDSLRNLVKLLVVIVRLLLGSGGIELLGWLLSVGLLLLIKVCVASRVLWRELRCLWRRGEVALSDLDLHGLKGHSTSKHVIIVFKIVKVSVGKMTKVFLTQKLEIRLGKGASYKDYKKWDYWQYKHSLEVLRSH